MKLPVRTGLDGACMLVFLGLGVISLQVMPPSVVDSKRASLEEVQPWVASLKLRSDRAVPLDICGNSLACISACLPPRASFRSVASP